MTLSTTSVPPIPDRAVWRARVVAVAPDTAMGVTLLWWATYLTWGFGGREPHVLSVGCALLAASYLLVRPWRAVPPLLLVLVHAVAVGAWVVVLTSPTGTAGLDEVAAYTYAVELGLVAYAWAADGTRRGLLLLAVLGAAGAQFAQGWLPWWGKGDPSALFQGTFYWHNQVGVFLAAGAVLGVAAVASPPPLRLLGWSLTPCCVAGVVYSTSRGSQIALALGVLLVLALALGARLRVVGVLAVSALVTWALAGPPFFADRVAPTAGTAARSESFVSNGVQRFEDWRRAWEVFGSWPLSGGGFNSFDSAAMASTEPRDEVHTAFAHNGYLQLVSDGGLVLAVPVLALLALVVLRVLTGLPSAVRSRDALRLGGAGALLVLLLHSGMDFDWGYPALLAMLALVAVVALPLPSPGPAVASRWTVALASLGLVLLVVAVGAGWSGGLDLNAAVS